MRRVAWWRESSSLAIGLAVALVALAMLPHHHEHATTPLSSHACRLCKLQDGVSATPPAASAVLVAVTGAWRLAWQPVDAPRVSADCSPASPRAPPRLT